MGPHILDSIEIADTPLAGLAELCEAVDAGSADPAAELRSKAEASGVEPPGARGLSDKFQRVLDFVRRRQFQEDLGCHTVPIPWLELHVPSQSTAALKWQTSETTQSSFNLSLFGSGYGRGRKISWAMKSEIPARTACLKFIQLVEVRVVLYSVPGKSGSRRLEPSVDVLGSRGRQIQAWPDCPFCRASADAIDEFEYQRGQSLDLRALDSKYPETYSRDISSSSQTDLALPLKLPVLAAAGVKCGISVQREVKMTCELAVEFAPGAFYQPYWPASQPESLPYWACNV